ncbi:Serine/threonine protein phosphatase 2A 55 kDa regulatory subunit B beta isoform, partial [Ananas comosus]
SSNGSIRLIDMRQSALCDKHSQLFVGQKSPALWSPFTGIISSISDIKFEKNGRHILSRDYMTVKLWDINMDSGPVATFSVHEYLRPMVRLESPGADTSENSYENSYEDSHDFSNKLLHLAWHPTDNIIACAAASSLYMFSA